ncbi:MAG: S1 family peptidase [Bradymonadia bacterium]
MRSHIALLALLLLPACETTGPEATSGPAVEGRASAIVGGRAEGGWSGVGALTYDSRNTGYTGSFCTGALIDRRWVLTAAHCIRGLQDDGRQVTPANVYFYMGPDARPTFRGPPNNGTFYPVQEIHLHPGYNDDDYVALYDIALLELSQNASEAVYPYFEGDLAPYVGDDLFYVGYGVSDGVSQEGGGVKRSTFLTLSSVSSGAFVTDHGNSGVCQGDSGGPAFLQVDGRYHIIGVNNSVAGSPACLGVSVQIQTATYAHWIQRTMGAVGACGANTCSCPEACVDGACDELRCNADACGSIFNCFNSCQGDGCEFGCYAEGSPEGRATFDTAIQCMTNNCANAADYQACVQQRCGEEIDACFDAGPPPPPGDGDCETLLNCANSCGNAECQQQCYANGSAQAREDYETLINCVFERCEGLEGDAFNDCAYDRCGNLWATCIPGDECAVTGGDCGAGAACLPGPWPATYCEPSNDREAGQLCNPQVVDCADGLICADQGFGTRCETICTDAAQCEGTGAECRLFGNTSVTMGVCSCEDADRDGACDTVDCDDNSARRRPGAVETCDDIDNDCDDAVDEMCGECEPEEEVCDDVDNDCDGQVDEGCNAGGAGGGMGGAGGAPAGGAGGEPAGGAGGAPVAGAGGEAGAGGLAPGGAGGSGGAQPPPTVNRVSSGGDGGGCDTTGGGALSVWWLLMLAPLVRRRRGDVIAG